MYTIKRTKYFEINNTHSKPIKYCLIMSHMLKDIPEYSSENHTKYLEKLLLSFHKLYLTSDNNMIFKIGGTGNIPNYLKTKFKIKPNEIQNIYNIYDRHNIKISAIIINWNSNTTLSSKNIIQFYKLEDLIKTQDIYESIIFFNKTRLKERKIMNDDKTIKTTFYHLYRKMIGEFDISKYNLNKYINNNT